MRYFVNEGSIVKKIWGKSDTILFIFAGASAEFAINKAVDWLYFTGRLPSDPLGRLFSTVSYARQIVFSSEENALVSIDKITAIHQNVEQKRGAKIPDWAYRDVLFMLIDYSIRSFEVLERKLSEAEKEEVFSVFYRVGKRMQIPDLPANYADWKIARLQHLDEDLAFSELTDDLYLQYKKHLGSVRFLLLQQVQKTVCPEKVKELLAFESTILITALLPLYKLSRFLRADSAVKSLLLPPEYKDQIKALDAE